MKRLISYLLFLIILLTGCQSSTSPEPVSKNLIALGTIINITIYDDNYDESLIELCFDEVKRLETLLSVNIKDSEVSMINQKAGISEIRVSSDTMEVIKRGIYYGKLSNGNFDITIGPLVNLWAIGSDHASVPTNDEIHKTFPLMSYKMLMINEDNNTVFLPFKDMAIDLGGIAKGYIADRLIYILSGNGCNSAIVNVGGNVMTLGQKPSGELWKIGVQDPNESHGTYKAVASIEGSKSVVTSGIYERFFIEDGIYYHHILSPFTGFPYKNNIAGVTIFSDYSIDGDALSTTCFSLGLEQALNLVESLENIEAVFIDNVGQIHKSSGIGSTIIFEIN
ncbi:MAG: FAD:protein FMN transferase [Clostridiales bacterium]|nr:FAD:protein FMN transferase [Clostridiales bacterium]